jgi:secreted PhoX family phosphatase
VVELDPTDPRSVPVKRTALGRMNHGDLAATLTRDGKAVVYAINRLPGGQLFRFISDGPATDGDALDSGTLAVAKLAEGGELTWLPLTLPAAAASRTALADLAAATRSATVLGGLAASGFHTPSGLSLDPRKPRLLLACRGDGSRPAGYVLEIAPTGGDDAAATARVTTLFAAGDPQTIAAQYGRSGLPAGSAWVENPETVAVDTRGRAWVGTDRGGAPGAQANGLFVVDLDGPGRGVPLPMYGAPRGAAVGGAALTPDGEVLFTAVRHPGAEPGATFARPGTRWPAFEAGVPPRTTLIGIERVAGGAVGG